MIKSYYVLNDGRPLFITPEIEISRSQALLSGFLTAIQTFASSLDKSKIHKIETNTSTFYYADVNPILSVIEAETTNDEIEARFYQITAERLARSFINKYPEQTILNWNGDLVFFKDFTAVYKTILNETQEILKKKHKGFVSEYFLEAAANENIMGVVAFDLDNDEIIASDIPKEFSTQNFESLGSMLFTFTDRMGKELDAGGINEMIIRAKNYWIGGFRKEELAVFMIYTQDYFGSILPKLAQNF